jgi:CheY-like chemotaxis protein
MKTFHSILLVDDDPISNFMTTYFLSKTGICTQVSISKNGMEALQFLQENSNHPPEVILLDVHMPVMDGLEFLQLMFTNGFDRNKTTIIFYTITTKDIEKAKAKFGIELIDKPLTAQKFYEALCNSQSIKKVG